MTERDIKDLFSRFTGEITQTPPKQSAVAKRPRKRHIYYLLPLQVRGFEVLFEVHCQAGTYVRVLVSEMGRFTHGAKMEELRRICVGEIKESQCVTLQTLSDAMWAARENSDEKPIGRILLAPQAALQLPQITIRDSAIESVCAGSQLFAPGASVSQPFSKGDALLMLSAKGELIGVARALVDSQQASKMRHGAIAKTECIIMKRGTYSAAWNKRKQEGE